MKLITLNYNYKLRHSTQTIQNNTIPESNIKQLYSATRLSTAAGQDKDSALEKTLGGNVFSNFSSCCSAFMLVHS